MLKKTDVYEFIKKVERKAINSVKEKHEILIDQAIESYLNKPENKDFKTAIKETDEYSLKSSKAQSVIHKHTGITTYYVSETNMKESLFKSYRKSPSDLVNQARSERDFQVASVEKEYAKIMRICQNKKTGEQAKTALIALGFDVAWLDNLSNLPVVVNEAEFKIDKSLVFPCGESGI